MGVCLCEHYVLPTIDFVGGETQDLAFRVYFYKPKKPFPLDGCTANFAIVDHASQMDGNSTPIMSKPMKTGSGGGKVKNILSVTLLPEETVDLNGKYIYQVSIRDIGGDVEIPKQGVLFITNNIDKKFLTNKT